MSKAAPSRQSVHIPVLEDVLQDIGDGCSLAVLVSFYCPEALQLQGNTM